jgi:hypothetical protein
MRLARKGKKRLRKMGEGWLKAKSRPFEQDSFA